MSISLNTLPLGFRFRPTDKELIDFYLRHKINGQDDDVTVIREVDVCRCEPWDLPDMSVVQSADREWFFFCPLDRKYPSGSRLNRATVAGYWKATGKDRMIKSGKTLIGMKKTLVFYRGRAPKGERTSWIMHEYRTTLDELDGTKPGQGAFVLCRLFHKEDESVEEFNCNNAEPSHLSTPTAVQPSPDEMQSEQTSSEQSPLLENHVLNLPTKVESLTPELSERTISETPAPLDEQTTMQEMRLEEDLNFYIDSPVQAELGPAYMTYTCGSDFSNGVQCPLDTNISEEDILALYDSIINNPDDFSFGDSDNGMRNNDSGSEPEVGQQLHLETVHELGHSMWFDDLGLKDPQEIEITHGTDDSWQSLGLISNAAEHEDESSLSSVLDEVSTWFNGGEELSNPVNALDICNKTIETGIKIRQRQPKDTQGTTPGSMQGNASRRLRLQCEIQNSANSCVVTKLEPTHMKEQKVEEKYTVSDSDTCASAINNSVSNLNANCKTVQVFKKTILPNKRVSGYYSWGRKFSLGSSESSPFRRSPATLMFKIAIIAVLFAMFVGAWRCLGIDAAARTYRSKRMICYEDVLS
ncbi:hypothetical protein ACFE04_008966 [Oxalis oulophora]